MLEEMGIANSFVPRAVWRSVRAKDRRSKFKARGWGSLAAIWTMAQAAESDEDLLVCTSAVLATAFCLRISESTSIRVQDPDLVAATVSYFDEKTRRCWITRPASTYIVRLMGFARAAALRLGRKPFQPLVQGGARARKRHWSSFLGKANMTTYDGIVGDALGQPCLSDMARRSRNCSPRGDGGQSKQPAGMWLPGRIAPGLMSTYPDLPWWKENLDSGNSSKGLIV